jgi:hypothetical protein
MRVYHNNVFEIIQQEGTQLLFSYRFFGCTSWWWGPLCWHNLGSKSTTPPRVMVGDDKRRSHHHIVRLHGLFLIL